MSLVYIVILCGLGLLVWSSWRNRVSPHDVLSYRVEKDSRGAPPEGDAMGGPLARRRVSTLLMLGFTLLVVAGWASPMITRMMDGSASSDHGRALADGIVGITTLVLLLGLSVVLIIQLYTEVDARGIHRPAWAGGAFIPWSSVTEVSIAGTYLVTVLEIRSDRKKVLLTLEFFRNPAALIQLLRNHLPADRLKDL